LNPSPEPYGNTWVEIPESCKSKCGRLRLESGGRKPRNVEIVESCKSKCGSSGVEEGDLSETLQKTQKGEIDTGR